MRVRIITDWYAGGVKVHAAGAIKDLDEAQALRFIRRSVAEEAVHAEPSQDIESDGERDTAKPALQPGERSDTTDVTAKPPRRKKP